jgi:hypothetical protein
MSSLEELGKTQLAEIKLLRKRENEIEQRSSSGKKAKAAT